MSFHTYPLIFVLAQLIFTYGISSLVIYQLFCQLLNAQGDSKKRMLAYSLGVGPISISWLTVMLFLAFPGHANWFYMAFINTIFFVPFILLRKQLYDFPLIIKDVFANIRTYCSQDKPAFFILMLGLVLIACSFILAIFLPYSENDALEYSMLAKIMYGQHSARMYPILDGTQFGGFIAPFTHPLGYVGIFIWSYLIQGTAQHFGLIKIVSPFYAFCIFTLIIAVLSHANRRLAYLAGLLFIATPLLLNGVIRHQIDALRIYTFFTFFMFLRELPFWEKWQIILPAGLLLGLCLFSHSIGILAIPIFWFIYLFFSREHFFTTCKRLILITFIGLLFVVVRYAISFHAIGYIIHDGTIVRSVPSLHFYEIYELINGIYTNAQKWVNGFFSLFSNTLYFGVSYSILILSLLFIRKHHIYLLIKDGISSKDYTEGVFAVSVLTVLCFFGMVVLSILIKDDNFIASGRYMMSVQPFVAILGAWGLLKCCEKIQIKYQNILPLLGSSLIFFMALSFPINNVFDYKLSLTTLFNSNMAKAKHVQETYNLLAYFSKNTSPDSVLLSFRNAEAAYYANHRYVYHTDRKMLPVYTAKDKSQAHQALMDLGINYLAVPNHPLSYIDQSYLGELIGDPAFSELVYQNGSSRLYKLYDNPLSYSATELQLTNPDFSQRNKDRQLMNWAASWNKRGNGIAKDVYDGVVLCNTSPSHSQTALFSGNSYKIISEAFNRYLSRQTTGDIVLEPEQTYQLNVRMRGYGNVMVYLAEYTKDGYLGLQKIWHTISYGNESKNKQVQFQSSSLASQYRLVFVLDGQGWINLQNIGIRQIHYSHKPIDPNEQKKIELITQGWRVTSPNPVRTYFDRLKKVLGFRSVHLNFVDNWQVRSMEGSEVELNITPDASIPYVIHSPLLPYQENDVKKEFHFAIKGKGQAVIEVLANSIQGQSYHLFKEAINLTDHYQTVDINLPAELFKNTLILIRI
ncbi:hypothetical protein Loa_02073 [Legionella oakridgensis ATCC 33761 = DSM 21215]|uniref:Uncharacterized protein n=1 Tax=Legionella oakridgensis ATCC 33761 = DSM 21215 TaxID=1268635 RepID=W0BG63_9GAMM|nr:hypothetical protein [Legionella oakridgensis]AHE67617.1 hypothetical protein Loa_02073 [Legionella oakridgensis ATCC 33761 = DSM 21215]